LSVVEPREPAPAVVIDLDVSRIGEPDEVVLETLARLQLTARRLGATVRLRNASPALADLIECAGLADVLVRAESGVEVDRQIEEREQVGVDEEVHPGDGAV